MGGKGRGNGKKRKKGGGREGRRGGEGREGRRGGEKEGKGEGCVMAFGGMDAPKVAIHSAGSASLSEHHCIFRYRS